MVLLETLAVRGTMVGREPLWVVATAGQELVETKSDELDDHIADLVFQPSVDNGIDHREF